MPSAGDADSTVTLIEFYDDHCGPCKANHPEFERMRATEAVVRIVYGQLPIFRSHWVKAFISGGALLRGGMTTDELKAELGRQRARRDSVQGASTNG